VSALASECLKPLFYKTKLLFFKFIEILIYCKLSIVLFSLEYLMYIFSTVLIYFSVSIEIFAFLLYKKPRILIFQGFYLLYTVAES